MVWSYPPAAEHVGTRDFGTPGGWEGDMDGHRDDRGTAAVSQGTVPDLDLVEFVVISVPELSSAVGVAAALKQLVESAQIRILDLVGIRQGPGRPVRVGGAGAAVRPGGARERRR